MRILPETWSIISLDGLELEDLGSKKQHLMTLVIDERCGLVRVGSTKHDGSS